MTDVDDYEDWNYDEPTPVGRDRRRRARRWRHRLRIWRKTERHAADRFWQARNRHAFDEEAPF